MPDSELDWQLLKSVSRSFYLTLRLLPGAVRESIALAYLLARLSDTKADGARTEGEKELLLREGELASLLEKSEDRSEIEQVWRTIQAGQDFDRERFGDGAVPLSAAELDEYTYLVAGCVGEFWTQICAKHLRNFADRTTDEMASRGVRFGKGLQLINVLRDRRADAELGRVYVPTEDVGATLRLAREHLSAADEYVRSLRGRRLRAACALPLLIGWETLDLIERNPNAGAVKVTRGRVWALLLRSLVY